MSSDENKMEQSEEQTSSGESAGAEAGVDGIRKRTSKTKSIAGKSRFNIRRKKSDTNVMSNTAEAEIQKDADNFIEPITVAVVTVDDLKEAYYGDLRSLVPPTDDPQMWQPGTERTVNEMLSEMHGAIDEINRLLDGVNLSMFDGNLSGGVPETACVKLPLKNRRSKPDTGVDMKTYRFNYDGHDDDHDEDDEGIGCSDLFQ